MVYVLDHNLSSGQLTLERVLGNIALDQGSAGLNGMYVGNVALNQPGILDGSALFGDTTGNVLIGGSNVTGPWTAEFVLKNLGASSTGVLLDSATTSLRIDQYPNSGSVGYTLYGVADYQFNPVIPTPLGQYTDVTFVGNPSTGVMLYVNGQLVASNPNYISLPRNTLGYISGAMEPYAQVDEVVLYNRALSPAELLTHVQTATPGSTTDPESIVLSPDNKFVYVGEGGISGSINVYSRNNTSGRLTYMQAISAGLMFGGNVQLAVSGDGTRIFAVSQAGFVEYSRDPVSGLLTLLSIQNSIPGLGVAASSATSPLADKVAVVSEAGGLSRRSWKIRVQPSTAETVHLRVWAPPAAVAFSPDGINAYAVGQGGFGLIMRTLCEFRRPALLRRLNKYFCWTALTFQ